MRLVVKYLLPCSAMFYMPFINSVKFIFATKEMSYESGRCKGVVLPQKERSRCQRELPRNGKVECRQVLRGAFSVKLSVPHTMWHSGRATGKSVAAREINRQLDEIRASALHIYQEQSAIREGVSAEYEPERPPRKQKYLTAEELELMMTTPLHNARLYIIRDLFLFSCYTGISYGDMCMLTKEDLVTDENGTLWIRTSRKKTKVEYEVQLLEVPLHILNKYHDVEPNGKLLPKYRNASCIMILALLCCLSYNYSAVALGGTFRNRSCNVSRNLSKSANSKASP